MNCYECGSWGFECAHDGDENIGELVECPDSPNVACLTTHRYPGLTARGCTELPDFNFIGDQDCVMRFEPTFNLYYFVCYCFTDGCNNLDYPPCDSVPGYCEPPTWPPPIATSNSKL